MVFMHLHMIELDLHENVQEGSHGSVPRVVCTFKKAAEIHHRPCAKLSQPCPSCHAYTHGKTHARFHMYWWATNATVFCWSSHVRAQTGAWTVQ